MSIANSSCCTGCQEASKVAKKALGIKKESKLDNLVFISLLADIVRKFKNEESTSSAINALKTYIRENKENL